MASDLSKWNRHHSNNLVFIMVAPNDLDQTRGIITGVDLENSSLTFGYYTDTRVSGKLRLIDSNYIRGSYVRILYSVPENDYSVELATLLPSEDPEIFQNGSWVMNLTLQSMLYGMDMHIPYKPMLVPKGTSALDLWEQTVNNSHRPYVINTTKDATYSNDYLLSDSQMARLYTLASDSNNRNDVDGHGRITINEYVAPADRAVDYALSLSDSKGVIQDGTQISSDLMSMSNRVVVEYSYTETEATTSQTTYQVPQTVVQHNDGVYTSGNSKVDVMINWAEKIAADNSIGYCYGGRGDSAHRGEYDCSGLVGCAAMNAGLVGSAPGTSTMRAVYQAAGWTWHSGTSGIKRGCVLWRSGHTELYIGNNQTVGAHGDYDGRKGDGGGREISIESWTWSGGWTGYLQPPDSAYTGSGSYSPSTTTTTTTNTTRTLTTTQYDSKQTTIYGSADASDAQTARGYVITDYRTVNELNPKTEARANELAQQYLELDQHETREWSVNLDFYLPINEGSIIQLDVQDGNYSGSHKTLVKTCDIDLKYMTMSLTLRELGL